jgi:hypothetical protein
MRNNNTSNEWTTKMWDINIDEWDLLLDLACILEVAIISRDTPELYIDRSF